MKRRLSFILVVLLLVNCSVFSPATPSVTPTTGGTLKEMSPVPTQTNPPTQENLETATAAPQEAIQPTSTQAIPGNVLSSLEVDTSMPPAGAQLAKWQPGKYLMDLDALPIQMNQVANPGVIASLTPDQAAFLVQNGFTIVETGDQQFKDIRFSVSRQQGQPYYLTTDAAYHELHLTFDEILKGLEREIFYPKMMVLLQTLLEQVQTYQAALQGTPVQADVDLSATYLAVALRLFDPQVELPKDLETRIEKQLLQIEAAAGRDYSALFPRFEDDYGAYKPVGHYAGDPTLERYFQGMTWLGRVSLPLIQVQDQGAQPSRLPLIVTLALREANQKENVPASILWTDIHKSLTYLIGPSDDAGPLELAALMDQVYGTSMVVTDLADDVKWKEFLNQVDSLPAPKINSTFLNSTAELQASRDWRLMGQRFTLDASIFQNLIYDKVGSQEKRRMFPSGLDVMAVLGSQAAYQAQQDAGETSYLNYDQQISQLQQAVREQPQNDWLNTFYSAWLYTFLPQVSPKNEAYPPYMRTAAWSYKDLNSALGSWAELKHDTALYTKMPEGMGGGGPPSSGPAPAYVEPNPEVFYRLAYLTDALFWTMTGIMAQYPLNQPQGNQEQGVSLDRLTYSLQTMTEQYKQLGDIAAKELAGQPLTRDDYEIAQTCLGYFDCLPDYAQIPMPEIPVVAAVSGADNEVLEVAVGYLDRIFVAVVVEGKLQIAQGGVFSYYEFKQPRDQRLTDQEWRERLKNPGQPRPAFTSYLLLPGGKPAFSLAFRTGDVYIITEAGGNPPLNLRAQPTKSAAVLAKLETGEYIEIIDGPVQADGGQWWKIQLPNTDRSGWVLEDPAWYERAYGQ